MTRRRWKRNLGERMLRTMNDGPALGVLCILDTCSDEFQVNRQSHAFAKVLAWELIFILEVNR